MNLTLDNEKFLLTFLKRLQSGLFWRTDNTVICVGLTGVDDPISWDRLMKIKVSLFANLKKYAPGGKTDFEVDLPPGSTLDRLMQAIKVPADLERVALVNGHHAKNDAELTDGDRLAVFPPFTGG